MALIVDKAIPVEWAQATGWTRSFSSSPVLSDKGTKRPLIPADEADSAPTLTELLEGENPVNPIGYCGFLSSMSSPFAVIDIDAPKATKAFLQEKRKELEAQAQGPQGTQDALSTYYKMVEENVLSALPQALRTLIQESYAEYSASWTGVHLVIKVDKTQFPKSKAYWKSKEFDGQLSITNNYMVTTGNRLQESSTQIKEVPFALLDILFNISKPSGQELDYTKDNEAIILSETLPSLTEVENALMLIPLDQGPRIQEVYKQVTGSKYEHYDFWLHVGMSLHDYATRAKQLTNGLAMFIKWSVLDKEAFVSDEDVAQKWESFNSQDREDGITYKTLFKLSLAFQFNYPRRVKSRDGVQLLNPEKTEYVNFKYLMEKYHLQLYQANGTEVYLKGDEDIVQKYFMLQGVHSLFGYYGPFDAIMLQSATWRLCQDSLWKGLTGTQSFVQAWLTEKKPEIDVFSLWLDEEDENLPDSYKFPRFFDSNPRRVHNTPEKNTLEYLLSCIEWEEGQDIDLCRLMLEKTMMQLIKLHEPATLQFEDNGGMFALIGPENTYKTTFFKLLLPVPLEYLRKDVNQELASEKNKRDFMRYLSTRTIVLVDEFEGFMDHKRSGSFFKAVISGNVTSFTDIYQTSEKDLKRKAILVGTSNDAKQIISENGSRRLWYAKIVSIDTRKMMDINLHKLYQNIRAEFRERMALGDLPWLMEHADTKKVTQQNKQIRASSSIDLELRELFPYSTDYNITDRPDDIKKIITSYKISELKNGKDNEPSRFMKTSQVSKLLKFNGMDVPPFAELERALSRYCKEFLGHDGKPIYLSSKQGKEMVIDDGRLCSHKKANGVWNYKFWILPTEEDYNVDD